MKVLVALAIALGLVLPAQAVADPVPPVVQTRVFNAAIRVGEHALVWFNVNNMRVTAQVTRCARPSYRYRCLARYRFRQGDATRSCRVVFAASRSRWNYAVSTCPVEWLAIKRRSDNWGGGRSWR